MSRPLTALAYKPVGLAVSAASGVLAGLLFKRIWRAVADTDEAPRATSIDHGWGEILLAAALQGAITALVKATLDRGGAVGVHRLTGHWPD